MSDSFFVRIDDDWFKPTDHTRGPWDEKACHAGPPTGLLARAVENLLPQQRLTRLTVNLQRPVPFEPIRLEASILRQGRTVSLSEARLLNSQGTVVITAHGMHLTPCKIEVLQSHEKSIGTPDDAAAGRFPLNKTLHDLPAFNGDGVQVRYPEGQNEQPGPTTAWLKTVPLLGDECPSAFQSICPLADCGNAFGRNAEPGELTFMNTDLTILLHRDPEGEWLGTQSASYWEPTGIGMADSQLFDFKGSVGRAMQSLVLRTYPTT